jgi:hypothetical protein
MLSLEFEPTIPAGEGLQTYALDRAANGLRLQDVSSLEFVISGACTEAAAPAIVLSGSAHYFWPVTPRTHNRNPE